MNTDPAEAPAEEPQTVDSTAEEEPVEPLPGAPAGATAEDLEASKPTPAELEVRREMPGDVYRVMDRADDELILAELQGTTLETYVYSYTHAGQTVTDLSVIGVQEAVRLCNERKGTRIRISADQPVVSEVEEEGERWYRVMVYAEDPATGGAAWGTAVEPKHMTVKGGKKVWDKFALTKALNKAERNAKRKLIPEEARQTIIGQFLQDETRVRRLKAAAGVDTRATEIPELPPPPETKKADKLRTEITALYDELRELNRMALVPQRFQGYYTRSNVSEEELERFKAYLEKLIEEERTKAEEAEAKRKAELEEQAK